MEEPPNAHDAGPAQMNYKSHTSANTFIIPITCLTAAETFICPETYLQKLSADCWREIPRLPTMTDCNVQSYAVLWNWANEIFFTHQNCMLKMSIEC